MDDKSVRQSVSASSAGMAMSPNQCTLGAETGPQNIVVRQVVGEQIQQKVLDVNVTVPGPKPAIEQIIDVFVKNVQINSVDLITDKVIVRGDLEIKGIYVACVADQAVHAVELRNVKWTQDFPMPGVRRGMDADASVVVEFVDYDVTPGTNAYRHKYGSMNYIHDDDDDACCAPVTQPIACEPPPPVCEAPAETVPDETGCVREFHVAIVLKITVKVLTDRVVQIGGGGGYLPPQPMG